MSHLHAVDLDSRVAAEPTPAVTPERKRELLSMVADVLDHVVPQLGDGDAWKWACIGIHRDLAETIAGLTSDLGPSSQPQRSVFSPVSLRALPGSA